MASARAAGAHGLNTNFGCPSGAGADRGRERPTERTAHRGRRRDSDGALVQRCCSPGYGMRESAWPAPGDAVRHLAEACRHPRVAQDRACGHSRVSGMASMQAIVDRSCGCRVSDFEALAPKGCDCGARAARAPIIRDMLKHLCRRRLRGARAWWLQRCPTDPRDTSLCCLIRSPRIVDSMVATPDGPCCVAPRSARRKTLGRPLPAAGRSGRAKNVRFANGAQPR